MELSEVYVMLAAGNSRLGNTAKTLDAASRAQVLQPLNSIPYRVMAGALIDAKDIDNAAAWLLAGFTVTGDAELRQAAIDLYRGGGDPQGCAIKSGDDGPVLNPSCETVRRHLCIATRLAIQIHKRHSATLIWQPSWKLPPCPPTAASRCESCGSTRRRA